MVEYVYLVELPGYCHEMVSVNEDGSHTIIVNSILSKEQQLEAYRHAVKHINCGHFEEGTADEAEREAHAEEAQRRSL